MPHIWEKINTSSYTTCVIAMAAAELQLISNVELIIAKENSQNALSAVGIGGLYTNICVLFTSIAFSKQPPRTYTFPQEKQYVL